MNKIPEINYLNADRGIKSWLFTLDHKRIGLLYLFSIMAAFALGGILTLAVVLLTVSSQGIKAAMSNPVDALRYE